MARRRKKSKGPSLFGFRPITVPKRNPRSIGALAARKKRSTPKRPKRKVISSRMTKDNPYMEEKARKRAKDIDRLEKKAAKERAKLYQKRLREAEKKALRRNGSGSTVTSRYSGRTF